MNTVGQREEDLFDAARKLPDAAARTTFLDRECAGDKALRARLDDLLGVAGDAETFFAESASALTFSGAPLRNPTATGGAGPSRSRT